ncbi:MAG: phenylalanine--tRNA ligase subunit beta, partial [Haemophilus parainfluenzae]|nr:phenylalanine--tRNA ligase subunit beta [Haemophilus parainfluenzae]
TLLHPEIDALVLPNPISVEMSAMRVSLLSGLLGAVLYNQNRQQNRVRLFETGLRFVPDANAEFGVRQEFVLAGVITGTAKSECWTGKAENVDFFDLKGDLESILSLTEVDNRVKFVAKAHSALHPGQSASIELDGKEIGFIGTIHPLIAQKLGLNGKAVVFEILWEAIANRRVVQAKEISKFPANRRDLALVVADNVPAGDIIEACKQAGGEKLTQVNLFDVYQGIGVASGHKSLAISLTIQDNEKTLEDDEINAVISTVLNEVKQRFNAELRD